MTVPLICRIARLSRSNGSRDIHWQSWASIFLVELRPEVPARGKTEIHGMALKTHAQLSKPISLVPFDLERHAIRQILATDIAIQMHYISKFSDKIFTNKNFKKVKFKLIKNHFFEKSHIFPSRKVCWPNNKSCSVFHCGHFGTNFGLSHPFLILTTRGR